MGASVLDTARQADEATLARYMIRCSLHTPHVERLSTAEMVAGGCGLGSCCGSSSLWCARCADNFLWSGCDREVADNIHTLKWLPPADAVHRQRPGKLEAALALVERVAARLKPLGQLILDELCEEEEGVVRAAIARRRESIIAADHCDAHGTRLMGFCLRGLRLRDVVSLEALSGLYARAELPDVAAQIGAWSQTRRCPSAGPDALVSRWLSRCVDAERSSMPWLAGTLLGYPVWTTIARYHHGAPRSLSSTLALSFAQVSSRTKRQAPAVGCDLDELCQDGGAARRCSHGLDEAVAQQEASSDGGLSDALSDAATTVAVRHEEPLALGKW